MKINVNDIPPEGLRLTESSPSQDWDLDSQDITYTGEVKISAFVVKVGNSVSVEAEVETERDVKCARCSKIFHQKNLDKFSFNYRIDYPDQTLDVNQDIREELILNFPLKPLCSKDCKGLCPVCGKNLNEGKCNCKTKYVKFYFKKEEE